MELFYKEYGTGRPLIILHGLFGSLDNWHTLAKRFGSHYRVIVPDLRNHGQSPHANEHNYELMAADVVELMEKLDLKKASLIGHSMGGKTAMQLVFNFPKKVEKLIVADMGMKQYPAGHNEIFEAMFALHPETLASRKEADERLQLSIKDFAIRQFLLKNLEIDTRGGYRWKFNLSTLFEQYDHILSEISPANPVKLPTLFVYGGKSGYVNENDKDAILQNFPNVHFEKIENAGHWLHAETPDAFYEICLRFLAE